MLMQLKVIRHDGLGAHRSRIALHRDVCLQRRPAKNITAPVYTACKLDADTQSTISMFTCTGVHIHVLFARRVIFTPRMQHVSAGTTHPCTFTLASSTFILAPVGGRELH